MDTNEVLIENIKNLINKFDAKIKISGNLKNEKTDDNIPANQSALDSFKTLCDRSIANKRTNSNKKKQVHIHLKNSQNSANRLKNSVSTINLKTNKENKISSTQRFSSKNKPKKDCSEVIWSDTCDVLKNNFDITKNVQIRKIKNDWIIENNDDQVTINKNFNLKKSNQKQIYSELNPCSSSNFADSAYFHDNTSLDEDPSSIKDCLLTKSDLMHKCSHKGRNRTYKDKFVEQKFQNHSEIIDDSIDDDMSDTSDSSSSGKHFKEFLKNKNHKKESTLKVKQIKPDILESLKSTIFDLCEFLFQNLIKILTWRTPDDEENYWINLIKSFFSTLINYTTTDFDRKMKKCLKDEEPKKFIRISKPQSNENNRFSNKINHIKCKLSKNNNKKFIPCSNNEKIYICKCKNLKEL